jgi:hypothetical protein
MNLNGCWWQFYRCWMFHCDYSQFVKYWKYRNLIEIFNVLLKKGIFSLYIRMREAEIYRYQSSLTPIRTDGLVIVRDQDKSFFMRLLKHIFFFVRLKWTFLVRLLNNRWKFFAFTFFQSEPVQVRAPAPEQSGQRVPVFCQFRPRLLLVIQILVFVICLIEIFFFR